MTLFADTSKLINSKNCLLFDALQNLTPFLTTPTTRLLDAKRFSLTNVSELEPPNFKQIFVVAVRQVGADFRIEKILERFQSARQAKTHASNHGNFLIFFPNSLLSHLCRHQKSYLPPRLSSTQALLPFRHPSATLPPPFHSLPRKNRSSFANPRFRLRAFKKNTPQKAQGSPRIVAFAFPRVPGRSNPSPELSNNSLTFPYIIL